MSDFIRTYDPPESELRSRQLAQEMQSLYQVLHEAEKKGQVAQFPGRTPTEVITNKSELPKLFLVPDPAQVVVEGQLAAAASGNFAGKLQQTTKIGEKTHLLATLSSGVRYYRTLPSSRLHAPTRPELD